MRAHCGHVHRINARYADSAEAGARDRFIARATGYEWRDRAALVRGLLNIPKGTRIPELRDAA